MPVELRGPYGLLDHLLNCIIAPMTGSAGIVFRIVK